MNDFDKLSARRQYGSKRRSALLSKCIKDKKDIGWIFSYEVDLDSLLKRAVGYDNWDKHWDVGLFLDKDDDVYILLSRDNELGQFEVLERVKFTDELKPGTWLSDCIRKHIIR